MRPAHNAAMPPKRAAAVMAEAMEVDSESELVDYDAPAPEEKRATPRGFTGNEYTLRSTNWKALARAFEPEFDEVEQRDEGLQLLLLVPGMPRGQGLLSNPLKVKSGAGNRETVTVRSQHHNKPSRVAHSPARAPLALP